ARTTPQAVVGRAEAVRVLGARRPPRPPTTDGRSGGRVADDRGHPSPSVSTSLTPDRVPTTTSRARWPAALVTRSAAASTPSVASTASVPTSAPTTRAVPATPLTALLVSSPSSLPIADTAPTVPRAVPTAMPTRR